MCLRKCMVLDVVVYGCCVFTVCVFTVCGHLYHCRFVCIFIYESMRIYTYTCIRIFTCTSRTTIFFVITDIYLQRQCEIVFRLAAPSSSDIGKQIIDYSHELNPDTGICIHIYTHARMHSQMFLYARRCSLGFSSVRLCAHSLAIKACKLTFC